MADSTFTSPGLQHLLDQMPAFCLASKASNTQRQYKNAFNLFCKFCLSFNITLTLPASDTSVSVYLVHLTNAGESASTINEACYAIRWAHRLAGLAYPCKSDLVKTIREGSIRSVGRCIIKKEPITPEILR
jgi:site-specific recombinase XerD